MQLSRMRYNITWGAKAKERCYNWSGPVVTSFSSVPRIGVLFSILENPHCLITGLMSARRNTFKNKIFKDQFGN